MAASKDYSLRVLGCAILSRVILLALVSIAVLVVSPLPYDTSSTLVFRGAAKPAMSLNQSIEESWKPSLVTQYLSRLTTWDALYFTKISESGYLWEHYHAFLPGYPTAISALSQTLKRLNLPLIPADSTLLSGFIVSTSSFVACSLVLYQLALRLFKNPELAYRISLIFCFSPANPFFLALYTESSFALCSFAGMLFVQLSAESPSLRGRIGLNLVGALCFACATSIRSNGATLIGFFLYPAFISAISFIKGGMRAQALPRLVGQVLIAGVCSFISVLPFAVYLYNAYLHYCVAEVGRPWCVGLLPNIYGFVQEAYWNVGFLRYFRPHQLPNFLLAAPVIILSILTGVVYFKASPKRLYSLGLINEPNLHGFLAQSNFVFVAQLLAVLAISFPFIHIQVLTRFLLSQCPAIYFFVAHVLSGSYSSFLKKAILTYMALFNVIGVVLFVNFLPWT